eukprot:8050709-Pyramimonas_sp.AAC.1
MDQVVSFAATAGPFIDAGAALTDLTAERGMTFSMWFFPEGTVTMPLATFGYVKKAGETAQAVMLYKLEWVTHTKWQFSDGSKSLRE